MSRFASTGSWLVVASLALALAVFAPWDAGRAAAHVPHAGLDFSIDVDVNGDTAPDCGTGFYQPTSCSVLAGATFKVKVHLNSLGGIRSYEGFDLYLSYAGVGSKDNPTASLWPDCVYSAVAAPIPGRVAWGCAVDVLPTPASTYTGPIASADFNCTADGVIDLVHAPPQNQTGTQLWETGRIPPAIRHTDGGPLTESLAIDCIAALPTPTPQAVGGLGMGTSAGGRSITAGWTMLALGLLAVFGLASARWTVRHRTDRPIG